MGMAGWQASDGLHSQMHQAFALIRQLGLRCHHTVSFGRTLCAIAASPQSPAAMWSVPPQDDPEERCNRLISLYELQIQELEATKATPYWDGEILGVLCSASRCPAQALAASQPAPPQTLSPPKLTISALN